MRPGFFWLQLVLIGGPNGIERVAGPADTGLFLTGEITGLETILIGGKQAVIVGRNDDKIQVFAIH